MMVRLYDKRTITARHTDVPWPLEPELTISYWVGLRPQKYATRRRLAPSQRSADGGHFQHDVYRRTGEFDYAFIGTAPSSYDGEPAPVTIPWVAPPDDAPVEAPLCGFCHHRV